MRVLHIIPSAFNYFDDIRIAAFKILDALGEFGVETEAFTLQYNYTPLAQETEKPRERLAARGTSSTFLGMTSMDEAFASFEEFDILHLHVPFLGVAGRIIRWKKAHPTIPLVVTYYRPDRLVDLYSIVLFLYSAWYLPKILRIADLVTCLTDSAGQKLVAGRKGNKIKAIVTVDDTSSLMNTDLTTALGSVQLSGPRMVAYKYALLYNDITR